MMITKIKVAARSDTGRQRAYQEDSFGHPSLPLSPADVEKGVLLIVADGVGGHQAGDEASSLAVSTIQQVFREEREPDSGATLEHAVRRANAAIHRRAQGSDQNQMATTVVCSVVQGNECTIAHVGDSRAYLLRDGELRQLTTDHSWVQQQMALGVLTKEMARSHRNRHILTRSLGTKPEVTVDVQRCSLDDGDRLLLCTDGLYDLVDEQVIARVVEQAPEEACAELIRLANDAGGTDNITVLIASVSVAENEGARVVQAVPASEPVAGDLEDEDKTGERPALVEDDETAARPVLPRSEDEAQPYARTLRQIHSEQAVLKGLVRSVLAELEEIHKEVQTVKTAAEPEVEGWHFSGKITAQADQRSLSFPPLALPNGRQVTIGAESENQLRGKNSSRKFMTRAPWAIVVWMEEKEAGEPVAEDRRMIITPSLFLESSLPTSKFEISRSGNAALSLLGRSGDAVALRTHSVEAIVRIVEAELHSVRRDGDDLLFDSIMLSFSVELLSVADPVVTETAVPA